MEYKGYSAKVSYEEDDHAFHGQVIGIRDVVHFQGSSVAALEKAFRDSVDEYLAFCAERGEQPDKPYSGKLVFRTTPSVHRAIALAAERIGKSINQFLEDAALRATAQ